ncbi:ImmA/IrrE family metallo-endopeptidase [Mahella australiensis]|uniref:IrrE N-terminal-like domain-containing protein n=1 Tax=Mahella australiensis (strain DSM 15567 / CIP 107919 / 50-1 BON) TaxID=697281 RepID=F3ZVU9_MAHA5|nr:ImmA/IrrE family metallo-endopeptidase [Mahella australiensis]AEE95323.1 hypothetical protein Mahau_0100 [Mahella australiensis 50-1 BON]
MVREILTAMRNNQDFDNLLWTYGIICKPKALPGYIYGFTYKSSADIYHIFINEALNDGKKNQTVLHELEHIELGHFEAGFIGIIDIYYEQEADAEAQKIAEEAAAYNWKSKNSKGALINENFKTYTRF